MSRMMICMLVVSLAVGIAVGIVTYDPEASRTYGTPYQEQRQVPCTYVGVCLACGLGFDGKYNCHPGAKVSCPGKRDAVVEVQPYEAVLESGAVRVGQRVVVARNLGACR